MQNKWKETQVVVAHIRPAIVCMMRSSDLSGHPQVVALACTLRESVDKTFAERTLTSTYV